MQQFDFHSHISRSPLDDAGEGGGEPAASPVPAWTEELNGNISQLTTTMKELMQEARSRRSETVPQQQRPSDDDDEEDADVVSAEQLELMSRAEYGAHLMKSLIKAVRETVVGPLNERIDQISATTTRQDIQGAVKELAAGNPDFYDWKDEMIALATEHKGLPPARLYALARAENPVKAQKLDAKYKPTQKEAKIRFGGLTPNQSGTGSKGRKMAPKQAADVAWAETIAALGGTPVFDDEE